jgi:hypothetical protein
MSTPETVTGQMNNSGLTSQIGLKLLSLGPIAAVGGGGGENFSVERRGH